MELKELGMMLETMRTILPKWAPREIDQTLCSVWLNILKEFPDEVIKKALIDGMSSLTEWPTPATIKRLCEGSNKTDEEIGQDIATRIEWAMTSVGPGRYESTDEGRERHNTRLMEKVGEIGMEVIRQCGGWQHICDIEYDQLPASRKQWRDIGAIISKNFFSKGENRPQGLPAKHGMLIKEAMKIASKNSFSGLS